MSYELRKILGNRYVMLLLALAVAVNAALFYRRCTKDLGGFTRADVRAEYAHLDTLEQEYDALLNGIYGEDVDIMQVPDEDLRRYALLSTVRDEVETTKNYPEYLRGLCAETEAKLRLGLFSADPFAERTLEKGPCGLQRPARRAAGAVLPGRRGGAAGLAADGPAASAVCGGLRAGPADGRTKRGPDGAAAPDAARPRRALLAQGRRHAGNGACGRRAALWRESCRFCRRPRAGRPGAPHPDDPQHAELPGPADGVWLAFVLRGRKAPMGLGRGRAVLPAVHHDRPRVGRVPACGRRRGACPAARQPRLTLAPAAQPQPCGRG